MKFLMHVFVLLCGSACVLGLDCSSKASLQRKQMKCYSHLGIAMGGITDPADIQSIIQKDRDFMCNNLEKLKSTIQCIMKPAMKCLTQQGMRTDILPDTDRMMSGMAFICKHMSSSDMACVTSQQDRLKKCAVEKAISLFSGNTNTDVVFITCTAFEITEQCVRDDLPGCTAQVRRKYAQVVGQYLTPAACNRGSNYPVYDFTTMAPITVAEMVTMMPSLPHVNCYSQSAIQASQLKCFEREGLTINLPQLSGNSGVGAKKSLIDSLMANNKDIHEVCNDLEKYKRAMGCAMEVGKKCMPDGYKGYIPSASNMRKMMTKLCQNANSANQRCVNNKASELFDCGFNKGQQNPTRDVKVLLCNAFKWSVACQLEVLPPCGCNATVLYASVSKDYLNPPACAPIQHDIPQCDSVTDKFIYNTASPTFKASTAIFVAIALLAFQVFF